MYHHRQRRDLVAARDAYEQVLVLARVAYEFLRQNIQQVLAAQNFTPVIGHRKTED